MAARLRTEASLLRETLANTPLSFHHEDALRVGFPNWLQVCMHVDGRDYPAARPVAYVEAGGGGADVEEALAEAVQSLPWEPAVQLPLCSFVQRVVTAMCMLRDVPDIQLPILDAASGDSPMAGANPSPLGGRAARGGAPAADNDSGSEGGESEALSLAMDDDDDGYWPVAAADGDTPCTRSDSQAGEGGSGHCGSAKRARDGQPVDHYSLYQRFGKALEAAPVALEGSPAAAPGPGRATGGPTYAHSKASADRLMKELRHIFGLDGDREGFWATPVEDNLYEWAVKVRVHLGGGEEPGPPAAEEPRARGDGKAAGSKGKAPAPTDVDLSFKFPPQYPHAPPFVRVVRPRLVGGYVFPNGALCMELLTPMGWSPANSVESTVHQIRAMLVEGKTTVDKAATARKGDATENEARAEFDFIQNVHKKRGWSSMDRWQS